ncbi:hypothetical protein [Moraxella sp. ZY210820]|uniref:hypothetical protein n=1 Tax=unclassified Moraxella TaxID=2685852 RepID=UPI00272FFBD5|nr:hypothetical protein [Moraxella sp. ZY210820]WLF83954.1 hypothetical protein LU301_00100 [Moraxella sp. ZY210820]
MLLKKVVLGSVIVITCFITTISNAQNLPFVGTRHFNFDTGSGTGQSITIRKDGTTTIKLHGVVSTGVIYKGKYKSLMPVENGYYKIVGNKIQWLDERKNVMECPTPYNYEAKCIQTLSK